MLGRRQLLLRRNLGREHLRLDLQALLRGLHLLGLLGALLRHLGHLLLVLEGGERLCSVLFACQDILSIV